jgi:hypothetical protein
VARVIARFTIIPEGIPDSLGERWGYGWENLTLILFIKTKFI